MVIESEFKADSKGGQLIDLTSRKDRGIWIEIDPKRVFSV